MPVNTLVQTLNDAREILDRHEPTSESRDWAHAEMDLQELRDAVDVCLTVLPGVLTELAETDDVDSVPETVAELIAEIAVLIAVSGNRRDAQDMLRRAIGVTQSGSDIASELRAAEVEFDRFISLNHGRWLVSQGAMSSAEKLLKPIAHQTMGEDPIGHAAKAALDAPRAVASAPGLGTFNTVGVSLFGRRDRRSDGSYVATTCLTAAFIPLFPLSAYRVAATPDGGHYFLTREKLSVFARRARLLVPLMLLLVAAGFGARAYVNSTGYRLNHALTAARSLENANRRDEARAAYNDVIETFINDASREKLRPAAEGLVRVDSSTINEPATPESLDAVRQVVLGFNDLPPLLRRGSATALLVANLTRWAQQAGAADLTAQRASLRMLELAANLDESDSAARDHLDRARVGLAETLTLERPLDALRLYTAIRDRDATTAPVAGILSTIPAGSSLWLEAETEVRAWLEIAGDSHERSEGFAHQLEAVKKRESGEERQALLDDGDIEALRAAAAAEPGDHGIAVALARAQRSDGKLDDATRTLTALGSEGHLIGDAQVMLGILHADAGRLAIAERVLSAYIASALPPYQDAVARYSTQATAAEEALIAGANRGQLPADIQEAAELAEPNRRQDILRGWLRDTLANNEDLKTLSLRIVRLSGVVPASLTLGRVQLQRANASTGDERLRLLDRAEKSFLAIRSQAEGRPEFHLGLGQVYYRLGKIDDGERELSAILQDNKPDLRLAVASVYRELGLQDRAIEIATEVANSAVAPESRSQAAVQLYLMSDVLEKQESWLSRADQSDPFVRRSLTSLRARRLMSEGDSDGADKLYKTVVDENAKEAAAGNASAANNAAVAEGARFDATGDIRRLQAAVRFYETATRLSPESAIIAGNLGSALRHLAMVRVLATWFDIPSLIPSSSVSELLIGAIARGPERAKLRARLGRDSAFRRSEEVLRRLQILAPQNAASYAPAVWFMKLWDDDAGLTALLKQLDHVEISASDDWKKWLRGEHDDDMRRALDTAAARSTRLLTKARPDKSARGKRTTAALLLIMAGSKRVRSFLDTPKPLLIEHVDLLEEAASLWPTPAIDDALAQANLDLVVLGAADASADAKAVYTEERRKYDVSFLIEVMQSRSAEAREALRGQPRLAAAKAALERELAERPRLGHWIVARAIGDVAFEKRAAQALARSTAVVRAKIDIKLNPNRESERKWLELLNKAIASPR